MTFAITVKGRCSTMRNFMMFLLLIVGCSSNAETELADSPQALANLKAQAEEVGQSAVHEDHARMTELTHPALVEKFGGREAFVKKLESMAAEMKGLGIRVTKCALGEPSKLIQVRGQVYAVVPMESEFAGPQGMPNKVTSYLIGVSSDGGEHWTFLDGAGIGQDRSKVKSLLPDFPDSLPLPGV